MSNNYDNWERLVEAVLRRVHDRELALAHSREPSLSCSSISDPGTPIHDNQNMLPGSSSDTVNETDRERLLLSDYEDSISRSVDPVAYATRKDLHLSLRDSPILLDGGKMIHYICGGIKMIKPCWKPLEDGDGSRRGRDGSRRRADPEGRVDGLIWYKDLGPHVNGEFSMAVIQANNVLEDQSQLESGSLGSLSSGPYGTFIGVYDGHGGPEASRFVNENLFPKLKEFASEHQEISADVIKKAFLATEEEFLSLVRHQWLDKPQIAIVGTCCLVGVICNGLLYIANVGDSRVVLGRVDEVVKGVTAIQLSTEHNANLKSVRTELQLLHPDDPQIVVCKHTVWRVKGIIQQH